MPKRILPEWVTSDEMDKTVTVSRDASLSTRPPTAAAARRCYRNLVPTGAPLKAPAHRWI
jgi:hypothetical protein